jgi:hypothetical protein
MTPDEIKELADPEAIQWDNFDDALIGVDRDGKLVYDIDKMIKVLVTKDGMSEEDAIEYLDFNVFGAYVGELTPIHINLYKH